MYIVVLMSGGVTNFLVVRKDDFEVDKLKLGIELKKSDDWTLFKLRYNGGKRPFYIQTNRCIIPYGRNEFPSFYIRLDSEHLGYFRGIERKLQRLLGYSRSKFSSRINDSSEYELYRVDYNPSVIQVYDEYRNEVGISDVISGTFAVFILDISYLWVKYENDKVKSFGYKVEVIQMRIFNYINIKPVFNRCMIENEGSQASQGSQGSQAPGRPPPLPPPPPPANLLAPKPLVIKKGGVNSLARVKAARPHDKLIEELKKRFKEESF